MSLGLLCPESPRAEAIASRWDVTIREVEVLHDSDTGAWKIEATAEERKRKPDYLEALPRYLTSFDPMFAKAKDQEAQFILALLGIYGFQSAGWVPYDTTIAAVQSVTRLHNETNDRGAAQHLKLWIYGHIVEAAAPYDLLANVIQVGREKPARRTWFPAGNGPPVSPGKKIETIGEWASQDGNAEVGKLLGQIWDRELRNAIFHADYALDGAEVHLPGGGGFRTGDEIEELSGKATAYHDAVAGLRSFHLHSYTEPKRIPAGAISADPDEELVVIVREGDGAVGLKDGFTPEELAAGAIRFRYAKVSLDEVELLEDDPQLAKLPRRPDASSDL